MIRSMPLTFGIPRSFFVAEQMRDCRQRPGSGATRRDPLGTIYSLPPAMSSATVPPTLDDLMKCPPTLYNALHPQRASAGDRIDSTTSSEMISIAVPARSDLKFEVDRGDSRLQIAPFFPSSDAFSYCLRGFSFLFDDLFPFRKVHWL